MNSRYFSEGRVGAGPSKRRKTSSLAFVLLSVAILVALHPACGGKDKEPPAKITLTPDEEYLIDTYVKIVEARDLFPADSLQAYNLFARLDSTTDTLRIANTIRALNRTPDRWIAVFKELDEKLQTGVDKEN